MKKMISKCVLPCLLGLGSFVSVGAEVLISVTDSSIEINNQTSKKQGIIGVRFASDDTHSLFSNWGGSGKVNKESYNGFQLYEFIADDFAHYSINVDADSIFVGELTWGATVDSSKYLEPLYSIGSCTESPSLVTEQALTVAELQNELKNANYYDASYRYSIADGLGTKGGALSGGFWDSYVGETQMQLATPSEKVSLGSTDYFWEDSTIATMSFMTLSMGQEFFGVDQQWLLSVGAKETGLGTSNYTSRNLAGAYGPWQLEDVSALSVAIFYQDLFPYDACIGEAYPNDATIVVTSCGWNSVNDFAIKYMDENGRAPLDHPKIVSTWLITAMSWWSNYDLLSGATDFGFKNALLESSDSLIAVCAMAPMYNVGLWGVDLSILNTAKQGQSSGIKCEDFPEGNYNYRSSIVSIGQKFIDAGIAVQADTSSDNAQILDRWIGLTELREFYFGKGADSAKPWLTNGATQNGGLMKHFNISEERKEAMWKDLEEAFNLQEKYWGNSKISLRYDWLSNLRIAKRYLDLNRGLPQGSDAIHWISVRSKNPGGIDGVTFDTHFPFVSHTTTTQDSKFNLKVKLSTTDNRTDDRGIAKLEWTTQENWKQFKSSYVSATGNDPKNQSYEINFPAQSLEEMGKDSANPNLYVRAIDSCGNAVVTKIPAFLKDHIVSILDEKAIAYKGVFNESSSFSVYSLEGEFIKSVESLYSPSFQNLRVGRFVLVQGQASKLWTVIK